MTIERWLAGLRAGSGQRHLALRRRVLVRVGSLANGVLRGAAVAASLFAFVLGLRTLVASARGVGGLLADLQVSGALGLLGFGWLGASAVLSGSPIAALSLTLLDGGAVGTHEAVGMLAGSRFGASFVVVVVGFISYLRGHRNPDGVYVGLIALITTATIYAPATAFALWAVDADWLGAAADWVPSGWGSLVDALTRPIIDPAANRVPAAVLFAAGAAALLGAFWLFDRALPRLDPPPPRVERVMKRLRGVHTSFLIGAGVTAVTMSVAVSVTMLVPLSLKGVVRREQLIPYVMGANITTFVDTLFAAMLLDHPDAVSVVLAQVAGVTAVSAIVLLALYEPYARSVHWLAHRLVTRRAVLGVFLAAWAGIPALLLAAG